MRDLICDVNYYSWAA